MAETNKPEGADDPVPEDNNDNRTDGEALQEPLDLVAGLTAIGDAVSTGAAGLARDVDRAINLVETPPAGPKPGDFVSDDDPPPNPVTDDLQEAADDYNQQQPDEGRDNPGADSRRGLSQGRRPQPSRNQRRGRGNPLR